MQMNEILAKMGGLKSIARELSVSEAEAAKGIEALLPAVRGGFKKQVKSSPKGVAGLDGMLGQLGGGSLLDNVLAPEATDINSGNNVLGEIFGSKDVSRAVAKNAAAKTGLDASMLKKLLPIIAMVVAGLMAKKTGGQSSQTGGILGDLLGSLFGGGQGADSGMGSFLDLEGKGNPLDDILGKLGR